jgi:hypothetical protein
MLPPVTVSSPSLGGMMGTGLSWLSSGITLKQLVQINLCILKRRGAGLP